MTSTKFDWDDEFRARAWAEHLGFVDATMWRHVLRYLIETQDLLDGATPEECAAYTMRERLKLLDPGTGQLKPAERENVRATLKSAESTEFGRKLAASPLGASAYIAGLVHTYARKHLIQNLHKEKPQ